jgi:type II secretory pathway component PulK
MARTDDCQQEQGAILINVLLIAIIMSIFMMASLTLINSITNTFTSSYNASQAYYNAKAGILVGEDQITLVINSSTSLTGITGVYNPYYQSPAQTASSPWSFTTSITGNSTTGTSPNSKTTLIFTITATGYAGNETSTISSTETATVTS